MSDSSSQSDDTSCGSSRTGSRGSNGGRSAAGANGNGNGSSSNSAARRRKGALNAKERNLRRLESNERERMRMHSLNDAFQVSPSVRVCCIGLHQYKQSPFYCALCKGLNFLEWKTKTRFPFIDSSRIIILTYSCVIRYIRVSILVS